mmetsp:Transcript_33025/g.104424  ORF Transcript_33025/g.104424 Transcript_33025/m.104424 type:complete len:771 (-) Transcript_33025:1513-3825(-)
MAPACKASVTFGLMSAVILLVYLKTLPPTIVGGDSGDIVVSAWKLSVPHPPGYPTITMIGHVFMHYLLPFGEPAWRMGVLNAIFAASSSLLLGLTAFELWDDTLSAATATILYSFSPLVWQYATTPEVFALNNLFVALLVAIYVKVLTAADKHAALRWTRLGVLCGGIALGNQHTIVILLVPIALDVLLTLRLGQSACELLLWTALILLGLSQYLLLALLSAAHGDEIYSWGDVTTAGGLLRHLLRTEYGTFDLISGVDRSLSSALTSLLLYLLTLSRESSHLAIPSLLLSCWFAGSSAAGRDRKRVIVSRRLLLLWAAYVGFFHWRSNLPLHHPLYRGVLKRFHLQPNYLVFVLIAHLLAKVCRNAMRIAGGRKEEEEKENKKAKLDMQLPLSVAVVVIVTSLQLMSGWKNRDQSDNFAIKTFAMSLLHDLPNRSVLLTKGDLTVYPIRYLQVCLFLRPDLVVMDQEVMGYDWFIRRARKRFAHVSFPPGARLRPVGPQGFCEEEAKERKGKCIRFGGVFNLREFFDENMKRRRKKRREVFIVDPKDNDNSFHGRYELLPHGYVQRVFPRDEKLSSSAEEWAEEMMKKLLAVDVITASDRFDDLETWEALVREEASEGFHRRALAMLQQAGRGAESLLVRPASETLLRLAVEAFQALLLGREGAKPVMRRRTWQACKNGGIAAEKAWRKRMPGVSARLVGSFFSCYEELGKEEDASYAPSMQYIQKLRKELGEEESAIEERRILQLCRRLHGRDEEEKCVARMREKREL